MQRLGPIAAAVIATASLCAQRAEALRVETPDGSVFVLIERPSKVAVWSSFVRMGRIHEAPGQEGLAEACVLASLSGTRTIGSRSADAEMQALDRVDRARSRLLTASQGAARDKALSELVAARRAHAKLVRPRAFVDRILRLPATLPRVQGGVAGTLLTTEVPANRLRELARLMKLRRSEAVLRDFDLRLAHARSITRKTPPDAMLARTALLAFDVHPARRALLPAAQLQEVGRQEALAFYAKYQRPERTTTVIVGGFKSKQLATQLRAIFDTAVTTPGPRPIGAEPATVGTKATELRIGPRPRLVRAWRNPATSDSLTREALRRLLTGTSGSLLDGALRRANLRRVALSVHVNLPWPLEPSLLAIDVEASDANELDRASTVIDDVIKSLRTNKVDEKLAARVFGVWRAERRRVLEDPRLCAIDHAERIGSDSRRQLVQEPRLDHVLELAKALFDETRMTQVRSLGGAR